MRVAILRASQMQVVQIVLWYLDSGYSKHMTGDRSLLKNFVKRFIGTIRFGNDHFGAIMAYGDYVFGDSVISRVSHCKKLDACGTATRTTFYLSRDLEKLAIPTRQCT